MRLIEIISEEEWGRLQQLVFDAAWRALSTYQQQRATQIRLASKPIAKFKPQVAKKAKALASKAKQLPHVAAPKQLPKPVQQPQSKAPAPQAYRPVKTTTPLPPTTRMAVAKVHAASNRPAPQSVTDPNAVDQAARRMLPPNKRGPNMADLLAPM